MKERKKGNNKKKTRLEQPSETATQDSPVFFALTNKELANKKYRSTYRPK